ncbi:chemotaxis protein CheW [Pseudoalteromonas sp. APC 3694]|jgi:purine-binding chemotaxis protein CheW|uniref:chemotaxis protein CheW n=1 Tax=Pseudoalteromonas sp. APC 3694 TaxID=3035202 RepID=UPI000EE4450C|nr:chemotaxis protein CheW [Pseudoalteromonas sp. APC 3694]MDN3487500.1 chemotaxis protein CheW [Pseudoalteromonas sp. APC 3694]HCP96138.1 chemotaxis protein CheW [Pseudoalteromonas sp.]|tara:strand:- start:877 stop:1599 length:723 start_codon:yes stop_codon:yes gene_type:complete
MSKQLFANEKVVTQYLGALLSDDEPTKDLEPVAKLLEQVTYEEQKEQPVIVEPVVEVEKLNKQVSNVEIDTHQEQHVVPEQEVVVGGEADYFDGEFQALFFEVAGLTLAVPLKALGGIHELGEVNHLFGKPKWFKGVMINREEKLNVVDTARWVMPEKYDEQLEASLNYQYLITLGDSQWGLLAEKLINNITLSKEDVKWRTNNSKRPWLAGVIKEKMCALIDVNNLNGLLEKGLDSRHK